MSTPKDLKGRIDYLRGEVKTVLDQAGADFDMSKVKHIDGSSQDKVDWIKQQNEELDSLSKQYEDMEEVQKSAEKNLIYEAEKKGIITEPIVQPDTEIVEAKTFGQKLVESNAYKSYAGGNSQEATIDVDPAVLFKTDMTTSAGWAPETTRTGLVVESAQYPLKVADVIPSGTTNQSAVVYMVESTLTNNAAEAAEAGTYGEGALALTETTSTVRKIAVFLPVTDEQLADVGQVASYVDNRLSFMLQQRLDGQLLTGNGSAPNLRGVLNTSGISTQAKSSDSTPDAIYKAIDKVRVTGAADPDTVILHPNDWQAIRLLQTSDGIYIWGSPADAGPERIWGLPVIQTTAETENTGLVGAFRTFSQLFTRQGIQVQISNSHSDYFVKGKVAVRADMRAALAVYRATAFCTVTGI